MRFYFKKEGFKQRLTPIYWQGLYSFVEAQCKNVKGTDYLYISCGEDEKTCLFYENLAEKQSHHCDFYVSLEQNLKIPREDSYLSSTLTDEQEKGHKTVCLFPTGTALQSREKAEEIWIIIEESGSELSKLLQQEVCSIAKLHGPIKIFTSNVFEKLDETDLKKEWYHCKKLISFSKNKALNHWLRLLLCDDFILHSDDASSPVRYAETNMKHPFLEELEYSKYDEACFFKYDIWTSALRKLNVQLCKPQCTAKTSWTPQEALAGLAKQILDSDHKRANTLFAHLKSQYCLLPFALPKWQEHKNSLPQLIDFVEKHPQSNDMQQLLITYLLNFLPQEHWYKIERFFADKNRALEMAHMAIDTLEKQFDNAYSIDFAYGTYIRSILDGETYTCGWDQNLATCFDFALAKDFEGIIEITTPQIKKKPLSGIKLTKLLLTPLLVFKKAISKGLINACHKLIASEDSNSENVYGKYIFYKALLYLLEGNSEALTMFLNQDFDPVKTQGYLGLLGLFLLKYNAHYAEIGKQLLTIEKTALLAKKPLALQIKAWGMLILGDQKAYEGCTQLLAEGKIYFKQYYSFPEKWFIQSKIEDALGHKTQANRFRFLHNHVGITPCIWEMFE